MPLKDDLAKMAQLKRTRNNLGLVQEQLAELRELAEQADNVLSALGTMRESVQEFADALDDASDDNPLIAWVPDIREFISGFLDALPEEAEDLSELIGEAESLAEEYESCLEDRDYSADDREEAWGGLLDALENIASAMT